MFKICPQFLGDPSEEDPPVPIPNTEVKLLSPDGTARVSVWESRKSPGLIHTKARSPKGSGLFAVVLHPPQSARLLRNLRFVRWGDLPLPKARAIFKTRLISFARIW